MKTRCLLCLLVLLTMTGCALQKDYIALQGRITLLEEELQKSQSASDELKEDATRKGARLSTRFDTLEEEIQRLRGTIEESSHMAGRQADQSAETMKGIDDMKAAVAALSKRLSNLESFIGYGPGQKKEGDKPAESSAEALYNDAKKAFDAGDMETARRTFEQVVQNHPKSSMADNAQFWIGEVYYREKWYQKAILEYLKVIENYPQGNKVPAAYLKQGLAFEALGEKDNAMLILGDLIRKFPESPEAVIARKKRNN